MIPEIRLLAENFSGQQWNKDTQCRYMEILREEQFFNGKGENDPSFSARDRINRAPKSLGFVRLSPAISLTPAGEALLTSKQTSDVFLRQMLKFQIPSPYHRPSSKAAKFCIKPYLELLRLVRSMGSLKFDELQIFGMQLTDWHDFGDIVAKIEEFRTAKTCHKGSYRLFKAEVIRTELMSIFRERISSGDTKTRESNDASLDKFIKTQSSNMRDYADACFRYLRATGLVNISHTGKSLSIAPERIEEVDYILNTIDRNPCFVDDECCYSKYLGNASLPILLTDNQSHIAAMLQHRFPSVPFDRNSDIDALKDLLYTNIELHKNEVLRQQVNDIKDRKQYDDIQDTFNRIRHDNLYDAPLMLEWNTWRAMTMLDGGDIKANLSFDDFGKPMSTAQGNVPDIVCDYGDYILTVEVTLSSGQRQYEMESESVCRHLGKLKKTSGKPCYCLFVAPAINEACIAHFYALHKMNISYYGGKSVIVPLPLDVFTKMIEDSCKASFTPDPEHVKNLFDQSQELAESSKDETEWYAQMKRLAVDWLRQ